DATGEVIGYASHSDRDWAPRNDFYTKYRADEVLFAHYRATEEGGVVLDTDSDTDSPAGELPWQAAPARGAKEPVRPLFFDAHGTENGIELHVVGEKPLVVDGARFARFMETLRDPAQPPAPVVLVACETAKIRSNDGGSVVTDAARAIPGRLWYAPDTEVGHAGPSNGSNGVTGVLGLLANPVTQHRGAWIVAGESLETGPAFVPAPRGEAVPHTATFSDMIFETLNSAPQKSAEQAMSDDLAAVGGDGRPSPSGRPPTEGGSTSGALPTDSRGVGDSEIIDSWRALSTLPRARRSNALRRIDTAVHEWANGGRELPGAHDANQSQLEAILDAVEAWKSGKNGPSERTGAVDRLTAHVRSERDDLHQRIAERAHQAQLLDRYARIHPDVSDFAGRRLPDRVDPANNTTHNIFTGDRTHHGALSNDALDAADELSRQQLAAKRDQAAAGGVTVDAGVSAVRVRELMDGARNDLTRSTLYPELNSYLDRANQAEALDTGSHLGNLTPVVEDVHGTQVTVHGDPTDSLRDARIDNFRKAVITVQEAGFHVPDVELHLPKYGRFLEVHNDLIAERSGGRLQRAEYLAPNAVIASPDVVGNPLTNKLADKRYRYLSTELDPSGVGTMVHELGHFLHYANARAQYHDLAFTQFAGRSGQDGDAVPHQALALGVSVYAAGNPREFVAEVFTGLVYGKPFSPEVMRMYHGLGGPTPTPRTDVRSPSARSTKPPGDS
ncbi:hypothetical protein ACFRFL_38940, partial [Streptomyces sp. NPDC056708]|uniref:hypothetical protein n=2 Tax=Streptomyces TaxID=1883 RepID=UPI00369175FB